MHQFTTIWALLSVSAGANQLLSVPEAPHGLAGGPQPGDAGAGLCHNPSQQQVGSSRLPLGKGCVTQFMSQGVGCLQALVLDHGAALVAVAHGADIRHSQRVAALVPAEVLFVPGRGSGQGGRGGPTFSPNISVGSPALVCTPSETTPPAALLQAPFSAWRGIDLHGQPPSLPPRMP